MIRGLALIGIVAFVAVFIYVDLTVYDESLQVGRMWETPAVKPHEKPIPVMASGSVPFTGGEQIYQIVDARQLQPEFALDDAAAIDKGRRGYQYYCIQCHGKYYDGMGTVGQSFAPLPGDLRSNRVQNMAPGLLFHEISYGIAKGRQPALATTIAVDERWQIIAFVKSLGNRP